MVLRLSKHVSLRINFFRERRRIHSRHVSHKPRVGACKALSLLVCFMKSRCKFPCANVAVVHIKKKKLSVHLVRTDPQNTFPGRLHKSRVLSCGLKSRRGPQKKSEQLDRDQARGVIQSCWPFQDFEGRLSHSDNLFYLAVPEFEPLGDLLWTDFPSICFGTIHPFVILELSHLQNSKFLSIPTFLE